MRITGVTRMKKHWLSSRSLTPYQSRCVHVSSIPKVKKIVVKNVIKLLFSTHFIHMGLWPLYTVTKQQNTHCRSYTLTTSDVLNFIRTFVLRTIVLFWCVAIFFLLMIAYLYTQIQIIIWLLFLYVSWYIIYFYFVIFN